MNNVTELKTFSEIKDCMRERLFADPATLGLNPRLDESPENVFEILAHIGQFDNVVCALDELLMEFFKGVNNDNIEETVRFLKCAINLCDALQANKCKTSLQIIMLEGEQNVWGKELLELQDLAAQALLGLPKEKADFRYWSHIAHRWRSSLPYALHAAIEIDLEEGLCLFWELYLKTDIRKEHPLVDWRTIINEADEHYSEKKITRLLEKTFYQVIGTKDPLEFETIIWRFLKIKRFTRLKDRSASEEPFDYNIGIQQTPIVKNRPPAKYPETILKAYTIGQTIHPEKLQEICNEYMTKGLYVGFQMGSIAQASLSNLRY